MERLEEKEKLGYTQKTSILEFHYFHYLDF